MRILGRTEDESRHTESGQPDPVSEALPLLDPEVVQEVETRVVPVETLPDRKPESSLPATRAEGISPFDLDPEVFSKALDRRKANLASLKKWLAQEMRENVDFGKIHVISKSKCDLGKNCTNPNHFSKPSLFKPGAEKICQMLGLTARFPNAAKYEERALAGEKISMILLRCELVSGSGEVVSVGMGARNVEQDFGDINKSIKMAEKSGQIDASIRLGLSDVYTQDLEDMAVADDPTDPHLPSVRSSGGESARPAPSVPIEYVDELQCNICSGPVIRKYTKDRRPYRTCELADRVFRKEPEAIAEMETFEKENPPLKDRRHYWDWEKK